MSSHQHRRVAAAGAAVLVLASLWGCNGSGPGVNDVLGNGPSDSDTVVAGETIENDGGSSSSGGGGPNNITNSAGLGSDPERLDFSITDAAISLTIINESGGNPEYTLTPSDSWVHVSRTAGTFVGSSFSVLVTIDRNSLPAGESTSSIIVSLDDGRGLAVPVSAFVPDAGALSSLWVSTTELDFGDTDESLMFHVRSNSTSAVSYTINSLQDWILISPPSGSSTGEADDITVGVDRSLLTPGTHVGAVTLVTDSAESISIAIVVNVGDAPLVTGGGDPGAIPEVDQQSLDFGAETLVRTFTLRNAGTGSMNYTVSVGEGWLSPYVATGTLTDNSTVVVMLANRCIGRSPGTYSTTVTITAGNGAQASLTASYDVPSRPDDSTVTGWLTGLNPLPRPHYSWYLSPQRLDDANDPLLVEFVRLTHGITLDAGTPDAAAADVAVRICQAENQASPAIPATIAICASPYWMGFWGGLPPWYSGPEEQTEINRISGLLTSWKTYIDSANSAHGANIQVAVLLLDTENWRASGWPNPNWTDPWNIAIKQKIDAMYTACKAVFPSATIDWFERGTPYTWMPGNELGDSYSNSLFYAGTPERNASALDNVYWRAYALSGNSNSFQLNPWVALGAGYPAPPELGGNAYYACDYNYDPGYAWYMGAILNDSSLTRTSVQQSEFSVMHHIIFYPAPFDDPRSDNWARHFAAYVEGATGATYTPR